MKKEADKKTITQVSQNERVRQAANGRKQKKRKTEVQIACGVIFLLLVLVVAAAVVFLKVGDVSVAGNDGRYSDSQIVEIAGISAQTGILTMNKEKISDTVEVALPYIKNIEIVRRFPDSVELQVEYADEAFAVDCGQLWLILSEEGKVLESTQQKPYWLPLLTGIVITEYTVGKTATFDDSVYFENISTLYAACVENGITDIRELHIDGSGAVSFNASNRFYVQSGSLHVLLDKMVVLKNVIQERESKNNSYTFTVATDGSITIGNREATQEEEAENPLVNMDSELVGSDEEADLPTGNTEPTQAASTAYDSDDSDSLG